MMDNFLISSAQLSHILLPILGAACLIALLVVLIKVVKLLNKVNETLEKIQPPVETVAKLSKVADETIDKVSQTRDKTIASINKGIDVVSEKLDTYKKKPKVDEHKEPSPEYLIR